MISVQDPCRRKIYRFCAAVVVAFVASLMMLITFSGCGRHGTAAPVGGSTLPPSQVKLTRNVELVQAQKRPLDYFAETVGYLEAEGQTDIAAGVTGVVDEVLFREGDQVDSGSVLVKIDQAHYEAAAEVARANENRAEANLDLAKDAVRRAYQAGAGASAEERARATLTVRAAQAELGASRAARSLAEHNLDRSRVRAPYKGQINLRKVTAGSYLEEKTPIATIADLSRLRLVGWVPEKATPILREQMVEQDRIRSARLGATLFASLIPWSAFVASALSADDIGDPRYNLEFTLLALPKRKFHGRIFFMSTVANPDTHMFECRAEVYRWGLDTELKPGYTAQIKVPLRGSPNACTIPEEAVRASERGFIAFVAVPRQGKDGMTEFVAKTRVLELGYRASGWVEVLKGVTPGEWIVGKGAETLEDGTPIQPPDDQMQNLTLRRR